MQCFFTPERTSGHGGAENNSKTCCSLGPLLVEGQNSIGQRMSQKICYSHGLSCQLESQAAMAQKASEDSCSSGSPSHFEFQL